MSITRGNTNANAFHHHSTIDEKYSLKRTLQEEAKINTIRGIKPPATFKAICLSGFRTEHNNATGTDPSDAKQGIENGRQFLEITVYPKDNYFSNPIRSPLLIDANDPDKFQRLQETIAYCSMDNMYRVRSYFDQSMLSAPLSFGQVVELTRGKPDPGEKGPLAGYRWSYSPEPRDILFDTLFDVQPTSILPGLFSGPIAMLGDLFPKGTPPNANDQYVGAILPIDMSIARVTSRMGLRIHPTKGTPNAKHGGVDIGAPLGTPMYAIYDGVVTHCRGTTIGGSPVGGFGAWVVVKHTDVLRVDGKRETLYSLYGHVNGATVKRKDKVKQGQVICTVGNEGQSTGPHLHFELCKDFSKRGPSKLDPIYALGWNI